MRSRTWSNNRVDLSGIGAPADLPGFMASTITDYLYSLIKILHIIQWFMIVFMTHVNRNAQNISQVLQGTLR